MTSEPVEWEGRPARLVFVKNLTLLVKTQDELHTSQTLFRALFNNTLDAMMLAGDQGQYLDVNPAASKVLGDQLDELQLMGVQQLCLPGASMAVAEYWNAFLAPGRKGGIFTLLRRDGEPATVEYRAEGDSFSTSRFLGLALAMKVRPARDRPSMVGRRSPPSEGQLGLGGSIGTNATRIESAHSLVSFFTGVCY